MRLPGALWIVAIAWLAVSCGGKGATPRPFPGGPTPATPAPPPAPGPPLDPQAGPATMAPSIAALVSMALGFQGVPYRNGGSDPSGFDCSGFVQYVFARHGTALPREVRDQFHAGAAIDRSEVRPGDLVFFETVSRGASHVGIAIGGLQFVHAPSSNGVVRVERFTADYWARRWVGARRIV